MFLNRILNILKRYFISGVLVIVPIILTYIVLKFLFESVDGILQPLITRLFGYYFTGLGIITTLLLIFLSGVFVRNIIGARVYRIWEKILNRMPIIRPVHSAAKQLLEALTLPTMESFKEVCLIEYPRKGVYALSFLTNRFETTLREKPEKFLSVFVPSTPTPISGMVILIPSDEVIVLDMTIEEGVKFLVSGGVASPENFVKKEKI